MDRQLTKVNIMGTSFYVDAFREVLRQEDDRSNRIPFQVFDQEKQGYRFLYDTEKHNVPESRKAVLDNPERYRWVSIPALMELDPEGIALRYEIPLEILCPENEKTIPKNITATVSQLQLPK